MNFKKQKKLKFVFLGLLFLAVVGFLILRANRSQYKAVGILSADSLNNKTQTKIINNIAKKDSDNDGLKNWEEELWGTDPNNSDTDGDRTSDGDEVNEGRNPLVTGPDDNLIGSDFVENTNSDFSDKNLTKTDKFAQNLFGKYLSLRGSKKNIDIEDKNSLVVSVIEDSLYDEINNKYAISDLNITDDNSETALKKYGNDFISITKLYSQDLNQDELVVFERMLKEEDKEDAMYLKKSSEMYNMAIGKLLNIKIPKSLAFVHLDILNGYNIMSNALSDMSLAFDDPIRGMNGFAIYIAVIDAQIDLFKSVKNYFIENKIIFKPNEDGYLWHII